MIHKRSVPIIALALCVGIGAASFGADSIDRMGYYKIMDRFFDLVREGKPGEAIDAIYGTSPYRDKIADQVASLRAQFVSSSATSFGAYHSHETLIDREIAGRYAYLYVFVAYDRQPLKMEFHFYRANDTWVLQKFSYSADVDDDIATFSKYALIKP